MSEFQETRAGCLQPTSLFGISALQTFQPSLPCFRTDRKRGCTGIYSTTSTSRPSVEIVPYEADMTECAFTRPRVRSGLEKVGWGMYSIRAEEIWKADPQAIRAEETWNQHGALLSDRCNLNPYLVPLLAKGI